MEYASTGSRGWNWRWTGGLVAAVLLSRLPWIYWPDELNVDETAFLVQAGRFAQDIVPWRAADCTTSGPVTSWFLLAAHQLGLPLSFSAVHALAALVIAATIVCLFRATNNLFGAAAAQATALVATAWAVVQQSSDFVHFSSELLPNFFMAAAVAFYSSRPGSPGVALFRAVGAGLLLGLVPWTKLQAVPLAGLLGLGLIAATLLPHWFRRPLVPRAWREALALVFGALIPASIILGMVAAGGALEDFWRSYVVANLQYGSDHGPVRGFDLLVEGWNLVMRSNVAGPWLLVLAGWWGWRLIRTRPLAWAPLLARDGWTTLALLGVGMGIFICVRPGTGFPHYQWLLLVPLALLTAATFAAPRRSDSSSPATAPGFSEMKPLLIAGLAVFLTTQWNPLYDRMQRRAVAEPDGLPEAILASVAEQAPDFKSMLVWGWMPRLYLAAGIVPPTRHAIPHYLYWSNPSQQFLQTSFMHDLRAAPPEVIVEVVGQLDLAFRDEAGMFPELHEFVARHYERIEPGRYPVLPSLHGIYVRRTPAVPATTALAAPRP